jgi:hypothetical protein
MHTCTYIKTHTHTYIYSYIQCAILHAAGAHAVLLEGAGRDADSDGGYVIWAAETIGGKKSAKFNFGTVIGYVYMYTSVCVNV